jgi:hypothetical protein
MLKGVELVTQQLRKFSATFAFAGDAIHRAHLSALPVTEHFGKLVRFNHKDLTGCAA